MYDYKKLVFPKEMVLELFSGSGKTLKLAKHIDKGVVG